MESCCSADFDWHGKVLLHTCALEDADLVGELRSRGAAVGGIFPLQTFQRPTRDLKGVYFAVGGDLHAIRETRKLVRSWGAEVVPVTPEQRLHAALGVLLASDMLTAALQLSLDRIVGSGLSRKRGLDALRQIVHKTLEDYVRSGKKSKPSYLLRETPKPVREGLQEVWRSDQRAAVLDRDALRLTLDILEKDAERFEFLDPRARGAGAGG